MLSDDFEIFHYRDSYLKDVALHHHDFYEVYFFITGGVSYTIESRNYRLAPGDVLLISPKELHQPFIEQKKPYERIVLWINCDYLRSISTRKSDLTRCFNADMADRTNLLRLDEKNRKALKTSLLNLFSNAKSEGDYSDIHARAMLMELAAELNRLFAENTARYEVESSFGGAMSDIVRYINENHASQITLDLLSQEFFISKYHMSREFMKHFGITIHRYITKKRLMAAKQAITAGASPSGVYQKCGFTDYSNFYRAFKAEYGISPKEFADYAEDLKR